MHFAILSLTVALALGHSIGARADMFTPNHSCSEPYKPYGGFDDEWARDRFLREVEDYRECINEFVGEQREQAKQHLEAAEDAIDEWNDYVQRELR